MKKLWFMFIFVLCLGLCACQRPQEQAPTVAATTWPVYQFTQAVCQGTDIQVEQVVTGQISCLHDYTLTVRQMQAIEQAQTVICTGLNLEEFLEDALAGCERVIFCAQDVPLLPGEEGEDDPHVWMDPDNAILMTRAIAQALTELYPQYAEVFSANEDSYCQRLSQLKQYGQETLKELSCRQMITFHDGFAYFAQAFDLEILASLEEEEGAMASASTLEQIIRLVEEYQIPALFAETHGSTSAVKAIAAETGAKTYTLDMAMSGLDYETALRQNIDTVKEALG